MTRRVFAAMVRRHESLVYTVCFQLVRDSAAARRLTAEVFCTARAQNDCPDDAQRRMLCRIAARAAAQYLRRQNAADQCAVHASRSTATAARSAASSMSE